MQRCMCALAFLWITVEAMENGRCEGNGYSQLGFDGMDRAKCFQRVAESMQTSNCGNVSWKQEENGQPQCRCFSSCSLSPDPVSQALWQTYTYAEAASGTSPEPNPITPEVVDAMGTTHYPRISINQYPITPEIVDAMGIGRCQGNSYSDLGFQGMEKKKCFQRVRESMQMTNCAKVSWNPNQENQPRCLCFSSCDTVSSPDGETGWETYTYHDADISGCSLPTVLTLGLLVSATNLAAIF